MKSLTLFSHTDDCLNYVGGEWPTQHHHLRDSFLTRPSLVCMQNISPYWLKLDFDMKFCNNFSVMALRVEGVTLDQAQGLDKNFIKLGELEKVKKLLVEVNPAPCISWGWFPPPPISFCTREPFILIRYLIFWYGNQVSYVC